MSIVSNVYVGKTTSRYKQMGYIKYCYDKFILGPLKCDCILKYLGTST